MSDPGQGQQGLDGDTSEFNTISFLIEQALALVVGCTLVQVKAVTVNDEVGPVGTVDVLPLINMMDGAGTASKHITIYKLPYARVQAGKDAIICDPVVGDIGVAVFADRDISAVKKAQKQSNPGSFRRNSMSDGLYLFTVLTKITPTQYIRFVRDSNGPTGMEIVDCNSNKIVTDSNGISITDTNGNTIIMDSSGVTINGVLIDQSSNVFAPGDVKADSNGAGVTLQNHIHGGVQGGPSDTDAPTPGT